MGEAEKRYYPIIFNGLGEIKHGFRYEQDLLAAYERGELHSLSPSRANLSKFKAAASATFKDRRVNIRLSSPDLIRVS